MCTLSLEAECRCFLVDNFNLNHYWINSSSGIFSISEGVAVQSKKDPSLFLYKVSSKLPRILNRYLPGAGYYQVVSTDYTSYAILYSCSNFHLFHTGTGNTLLLHLVLEFSIL